jgi:hypothetical protein
MITCGVKKKSKNLIGVFLRVFSGAEAFIILHLAALEKAF